MDSRGMLVPRLQSGLSSDEEIMKDGGPSCTNAVGHSNAKEKRYLGADYSLPEALESELEARFMRLKEKTSQIKGGVVPVTTKDSRDRFAANGSIHKETKPTVVWADQRGDSLTSYDPSDCDLPPSSIGTSMAPPQGRSKVKANKETPSNQWRKVTDPSGDKIPLRTSLRSPPQQFVPRRHLFELCQPETLEAPYPTPNPIPPPTSFL